MTQDTRPGLWSYLFPDYHKRMLAMSEAIRARIAQGVPLYPKGWKVS